MKTITVASILIFGLMLRVISGQDPKPELYVQTGHNNTISSVVFSPDGQTFATAGRDMTVKLWSIGLNQELQTLKGHKDEVEAIAFSPNGEIIASASRDSTIKLWSVETGMELRSLSCNSYSEIAFSPDGEILAAGDSREIKLWNVKSGEAVRTLIGHTDVVGSLAFSRNGRMIVSGSWDKTVRLWNAETGQLIKTLEGHSDWVNSVLFSPNDRILVTASKDKKIKIWDAATGKEYRTLQGHSGAVNALAFSQDGRILISGSYDGTIKTWNVETGKETQTIQAQTAVESIAVSPNRPILLAGGNDFPNPKIRLWSMETGNLIRTFSSSVGYSNGIALSPDGKTIATANQDATIKLWSIEAGKQLRTLRGHTERVNKIAFSPDGKTLASISADKTIKLWNIQEGKETLTLRGHTDDLTSIKFSPDGRKLATSSYDKTVRLWDAVSGKELLTFRNHTKIVWSVAFSPDGNSVASSSLDHTILLWNAETGTVIKTLKDLRDVKSVAFSPDGKIIAAETGIFYSTSGVHLWNIETGNQVHAIRIQLDNAEVAKKVLELVPDFFAETKPISRDGKFQVELGDNSKINLYDHKTGKLLASLIAFNQNDWAVVTPEGLFDGTPAAWKPLIWRLNNKLYDIAPVEAFFKEFYYPELLQEIIRGKSPKPPEKDLSAVDIRQPKIKIVETGDGATNAAGAKTVRVRVEVEDNTERGRKGNFPSSSGANDLRLFRNGSLVHLWKKKEVANDKQTSVFDLSEAEGCRQISAKDAVRKAVCETEAAITAGANDFTAYAFNHDNVKSNDATANVEGKFPKRDGTLYVLSVGVNKYQNTDKNLEFAVADARSIGDGVSDRQKQLKPSQYRTTEVINLTNENATRANILTAIKRFSADTEKTALPENLTTTAKAEFAKIKSLEPEDALIVYFAGHGTARCEKTGTGRINCDRFYLIPHDGFPVGKMTDDEWLKAVYQNSVSDEDLAGALETVDAGKILFVIDACESGQALDAEEKRRGPMNSRGLAQLAYEKGMYILTAAQSQQAALEISKLGHGLLTFSLLEGFQKADSNDDKFINEREWFDYASRQVPVLQLDAMKTRNAENRGASNKKKSELAVVTGDDANADPEKRGLQTPRVFYRREEVSAPLIVSKP